MSKDDMPVSVRLDADTVRQVDDELLPAMADAMKADPMMRHLRLNRSLVLRLAIERGVELLRGQYMGSPPPATQTPSQPAPDSRQTSLPEAKPARTDAPSRPSAPMSLLSAGGLCQIIASLRDRGILQGDFAEGLSKSPGDLSKWKGRGEADPDKLLSRDFTARVHRYLKDSGNVDLLPGVAS